MAKKEKKPKTIFTERISCPWCKKLSLVRKTKKLITPSSKAEYQENLIVEKDTQQTLEED